jgi:hypothetical protein
VKCPVSLEVPQARASCARALTTPRGSRDTAGSCGHQTDTDFIFLAVPSLMALHWIQRLASHCPGKEPPGTGWEIVAGSPTVCPRGQQRSCRMPQTLSQERGQRQCALLLTAVYLTVNHHDRVPCLPESDQKPPRMPSRVQVKGTRPGPALPGGPELCTRQQMECSLTYPPQCT